jgi:hypothetical protein
MIKPFAKYAVIPTWMQESSHRDVKLQTYDKSCRSLKFAIHGRWIPASLPE